MLGAVLLARSGFPALLLTAAAILAGTAVVTFVIPAPSTLPLAAEDPAAGRGSAASTVQVVLATTSIALFFTAMYAGSVALPLFVTRALHQPGSAVGVLFSVCAAVEVLAALALAVVPARVSQRLIILGGMSVFVFYFILTVVAHGIGLLVLGQIARGLAIAVVGAAGIRYFQELLAPATGRATTLFSNASTAGSLVAGVLAGAAVRFFGYTTSLVLCGTAAAAAALTFWASTTTGQRRAGDHRSAG